MSRSYRLPIIAGTIVVALLAADMAAWWLLTSRLMAEAAAWQQARADRGYRVTAGPPVRAGWPLRAVIRLPQVGIATGDPGSAALVAWRSDEARLVYTPWQPTQVTIVLDGPQILQLGLAPAVTVAVETLDLIVPLDPTGQAAGFSATARRLRLPLPAGQASVDAAALSVGPADLRLSLSALTLPSPDLPLGVTIGVLDLHARSTVPLPDQRDPAEAAAAWRDAGGQCVVDDLVLGWGPLDIHGSGTFGLDRALQPAGNATVRMTGFGQAIDALARSGLMPRNTATVVSTLLGLMSRPGPQGVAEAELPFTLANGLLSTGAIPLTKLPRLALP